MCNEYFEEDLAVTEHSRTNVVPSIRLVAAYIECMRERQYYSETSPTVIGAALTSIVPMGTLDSLLGATSP